MYMSKKKKWFFIFFLLKMINQKQLLKKNVFQLQHNQTVISRSYDQWVIIRCWHF